MKKVLIILMNVFLTQTILAQQGTIRGKIADGQNGEELIGVNVFIEGTTQGTSSDIDGSFAFKIEPGVYSVIFSYISYAPYKIEDVVVKEGEVIELANVLLQPESMGLEEVVITARALKNTAASLLSIQMKSANLIDGISAQTFSRTGDGDAAAAVKRVTGVTIEGGKYVYVRGLGDRYSKSVLNGLEIPGLDPEKNSVQMDIFPTNMIDNIMVYKSFTPDLPGDFTGGLVDITTKDFPTTLSVDVSVSFSYNDETQFKSDFILYDGEGLDGIGLGAKNRKLPFNLNYEPDKRDAQLLFQNTDALNKEVAAKTANNFLNQSYSFSIGNQLNREKVTMGYLFGVNYKNDFSFRPDFYQGELRIKPESTTEGYISEYLIEKEGKTGVNESLWNTMLSTSLKKNGHKIGVKYLHTQAGARSATERIVEDNFNNLNSIETSLDYTQRMVSNTIISGEHAIADRLKIDWANALTRNTMSNPDQTNSEFVLLNDQILFQSGSSSLDKVSRELKEWNNNAKVDLTLNFDQWKGLSSKVKFGLSHLFKQRDFESYIVSIGKSNNFSSSLTVIENGLNSILHSDNLYSESNNEGYLIQGVQIDKENMFSSTMNVYAAYAMTELPLQNKLKFIGGLRTEYAFMNYKGNDRLSGNPIDKQVLSDLQFLPSVSLIANVTDKFNVRTSYSRTLARPSFKEKSEAIIYDPIQATTFFGNLDLKVSNIHNADLRFEYFLGGGEMVALSGFYKHFLNPIEIQPVENGGPSNIKPVNRPSADVLGLEVELRKDLGFITEKLRPLSLNANFTFVKSIIDLTDDQKDKYLLIGQVVPKNRALLGQSPFVINVGLNYVNTNIGTTVNLSYHVKGRTLIISGIGTIPDVYEDSYHGLDFKFSQKIGRSDQFRLNASIQNIIGDNSDQYYEYLGERIESFRSYSVGRQYAIGFAYSLK